MDNVPVRQLFGTWFVIAVMPTIFEKGAHNAIETYFETRGGGHRFPCVVRVSRGRDDIDFRYNKNALDGPLKKLPQTGSSWYDDKTAWLEGVSVLAGEDAVFGHRKVKTALDNDAAWFVVWFVVGYPRRAPTGAHWVMARKPEMPRSVLDDIKKRLVTDHQYPEGLPDLVEVPQSWDRDATAQFGWKRRGVDVSPK